MACCSSVEHLINIGAAQTTLQRGVSLIYLCSNPTHISVLTIRLHYYNFYFHMSKNWKIQYLRESCGKQEFVILNELPLDNVRSNSGTGLL
jgi:hypothetical protein